MRIYIVEDDTSVIGILEDIVEGNELGVVCGDSGGEPANLGQILALDPDLVLVDLLMPQKDGIQVVRELKEQGCRAKFIMISQVSNKEMVAKAYLAGVDFFINKPINLIEVRQVVLNVRRQLENERDLHTIQSVFAEKAAPVGRRSRLEAQRKRIQTTLSQLGMAGEKGARDIVELCMLLLEQGQQVSQVGVGALCAQLSDSPKSMEQRARRAVERGLHHLASLGLEDYGNEIFTLYASRDGLHPGPRAQGKGQSQAFSGRDAGAGGGGLSPVQASSSGRRPGPPEGSTTAAAAGSCILRQLFLFPMMSGALLLNGDLDLSNVFVKAVDDALIEPRLIGPAVQRQAVRPGIGEDLLIAARQVLPWALAEGPEIPAGGPDVQPLSGTEARQFHIQGLIAVIVPLVQVLHRDHGAVHRIVEALQAVPLHRPDHPLHIGGCGHLLLYRDHSQAAFFLSDHTDFRKIQVQQRHHVLVAAHQGLFHSPQVVDPLLQLPDLGGQQPLHAGGGAVLHESLDLRDGDIQLPEHEDRLQGGALLIGVVAVPVFPDHGGGHQPHLVIPHQRFFRHAVDGRKLADGEQLLPLIQHKNPPLTVLLQDGL